MYESPPFLGERNTQVRPIRSTARRKCSVSEGLESPFDLPTFLTSVSRQKLKRLLERVACLAPLTAPDIQLVVA